MWIKICGNTNLEDALFAAEAGANAVGFVFAPSPRQVDVETVRRIISNLPAGVEKYGVYVDAGLEEITRAVTECGLTGVQIHRTTDPLLADHLRKRFADLPGGLRIVHALNYKDRAACEGRLSELAQNDTAVDAVLIDSGTARAVGGTGTRYDWTEAGESFARFSSQLRLIAAGGLSPDNVQQAIELLRPWGVDVVSGVESRPGKKDPQRVRDFIQAALQASKTLV
jgi:phosphoribosylanthranilate isomerase